MKTSIVLGILSCVTLTSIAGTSGLKDEEKTCGGMNEVKDVFWVDVYGQQSKCEVVTVAVVTGPDGDFKAGGDCGKIIWPSYIEGGCGEAVKGDTIPE